MDEQIVKCTEPKSTKEIPVLIDKCECSIQILHDRIGELSISMRPALRDYDPSSVAEGPPRECLHTSMGENLRNHDDRLKELYARIESLLDRLEL
jgi:hypothetical protein